MSGTPKGPAPAQPPEPPVLPEQTRDDLDDDWRESRQDDDERLNRERPPHWE